MKWDFIEQPAQIVAPLLLGSHILTELDGVTTIGRIVEVEAYTEKDPASHAFIGPTQRNRIMFGPAGHLYVYISYGLHYCMNVVAGRKGSGEGVLIRAIEPMQGLEEMWIRRYGGDMPDDAQSGQLYNLTNGPGKLTKALGVTMTQADANLLLSSSPVRLELPTKIEQLQIFNSRRIGISRGVETPWRWYLQSPWVSRVPVLVN